MISQENIKSYRGSLINSSQNCLYIPSHKILQPYISTYTIAFPNKQTMPDDYTILPTASSALVISVDDGNIRISLRGVNTKALNVGKYANRKHLLLLIEFHTGGLYPFLPIEQAELVDSTFHLDIIDRKLVNTLVSELEKSQKIETLINTLDKIFIDRLLNYRMPLDFSPIIKNIIKQHGLVNTSDLPSPFYYCERQTRRLFVRYTGISPKMLTRIVRANYALQLIKNAENSYFDVVEKAGYFDQSHLIHEFKTIHGITPQAYKQKMSVFYNDNTKM